MIFATCGSSHFRFDRLMEALSALPAEGLHVQHGPSEPPPCEKANAYMPFADLAAEMALADVVVTHAGVGSILCALRAGHTPIVFPRMKRYGEVVDNHQAELAEALAGRGTAILARTPQELVDAVASIPERRDEPRVASQALAQAVRASILGAPLLTLPANAGELAV